ncbi:MAG: hypothetical protein AAF771_15620 [Pseudomonadota bacterium]
MSNTIQTRQAQAEPSDMAQFRAVGEGYFLVVFLEPDLFRLMFSND